jgi:hypothetical protein
MKFPKIVLSALVSFWPLALWGSYIMGVGRRILWMTDFDRRNPTVGENTQVTHQHYRHCKSSKTKIQKPNWPR